MTSVASNSLPAFGFLTVIEDSEHGFFGGYLVLSELGRPLEFHCSTPVFPSPAQRILYGSTLRSYVLGELIGPALVKQAQIPVQAVLTDQAAMLSLALFWDGTLALARPLQQVGDLDHPCQATSRPIDSGSSQLDIGDYRLVGSSTCTWEVEPLRTALEPLVAYVDLAEPFQRIREAIQEAQRVTQPSAGDTDDHSAAA
jgi:hypothetical protein